MSDIARALDATHAFLSRYVVFPLPEQADAAALWVGHTWVYDQFDTTPYLAIQSPEKRSGKSRLMESIGQLVRQPVPMAGASLAALFRLIDERHPTLLLDEADTIFNKKGADSTEDVRGLLNNGYRRGVPYFRVAGEGRKMRVEAYDVFCPKAIASIRQLPDTVQDRSIVVNLKRRARRETVGRFRFRHAEREAIPIREWWEAIASELTLPEEVDVPDELDDRAADSWEPLVALAGAAGDEWAAKARHAAVVLSGVADVDDQTLPLRLLAGIRSAFDEHGAERLATSTILESLHADDEAPWADWHGRGLRAEGLAYLLRAFSIRSRQMKVDGVNVRGFERDAFADAWDRYLPSPATPPPTRSPGTLQHESEHGGTGVTGESPVPGKGTTGLNGGAPRINPNTVEGRFLALIGELEQRPPPPSGIPPGSSAGPCSAPRDGPPCSSSGGGGPDDRPRRPPEDARWPPMRACAECGQPAPRGVLCPPCFREAQAARPLPLPRPEPEPRPIPFCPCGAVRGVVEIGGRWRCAPCHAGEPDGLEDAS